MTSCTRHGRRPSPIRRTGCSPATFFASPQGATSTSPSSGSPTAAWAADRPRLEAGLRRACLRTDLSRPITINVAHKPETVSARQSTTMLPENPMDEQLACPSGYARTAVLEGSKKSRGSTEGRHLGGSNRTVQHQGYQVG